ncbi:MAG: transposase [gamma proteobacterium symbiont of Lucinoma myriamae]|nr:transposase [gamma proteobacterium symbiont of Lucinoma myriamae]
MKENLNPEIRGYIKTRSVLNIPCKTIFSELCDVYGPSNVSRATVYRWYKKFKDGKFDTKDDPHTGRPKSAITSANISAVHNCIKEDARYTLQDLSHIVGISSASVHEILTKHLKVKKICARWVPHLLTDAQKAMRVQAAKKLLQKYKNCSNKRICELLTGDETWVFYFEPQRRVDNKQWMRKGQERPIIAKRSRSAKKVLYSIFFNSSGPVVQIPTPNGRSITGNFYKNSVLKKVKQVYEKRRPATGLRGICLLHDNAAAHKSQVVQQFLEEEKVVQLPHPPYSPDLSPCDFFLFPRLKKMLSGRGYTTKSSLGSAIFQFLQSIPVADYAAAFRQWISRLEKCVSVNGEYFEGLH